MMKIDKIIYTMILMMMYKNYIVGCWVIWSLTTSACKIIPNGQEEKVIKNDFDVSEETNDVNMDKDENNKNKNVNAFVNDTNNNNNNSGIKDLSMSNILHNTIKDLYNIIHKETRNQTASDKIEVPVEERQIPGMKTETDKLLRMKEHTPGVEAEIDKPSELELARYYK